MKKLIKKYLFQNYRKNKRFILLFFRHDTLELISESWFRKKLFDSSLEKYKDLTVEEAQQLYKAASYLESRFLYEVANEVLKRTLAGGLAGQIRVVDRSEREAFLEDLIKYSK